MQATVPCVVMYLLLAGSVGAQATVPSPLGNSSQDFGGIRTFLRAPHVSDLSRLDADIAILGVPVDQGTSNRPGQRYGPRDIREASLIYAWAPAEGFYYIDTEQTVLKGVRWADLGDVDVVPSSMAQTSRNVTTAVAAIVRRGAFPVVLGGDHSIAFPVVRGLGVEPITVVHFDAHLDAYGDGDPDVLNHGGWVQQTSRLPGVRFVQIGMRGIANDAGGVARARRLGSTIVTAERVHREGVRAVLASLPELGTIYVSLDIDVLDPSLAPGTGTLELGGLTFQQMHELLVGLPRKGRVIGLDVVEVNPFYDDTGVTAQTAVRLIIDLLGAVFRSR
ncbi:MAG: agmatinase [Gemmatimonadaceae bacterium]|nr:agmatinase [Gemmatimonadaceae bacterium]